MEYPRRKNDIILFREYEGNEDKYPKYDNYNAINVDKVADIPKDFNGLMGVPISFIGQWNPEQFNVLGLERYIAPPEALSGGRFTIDGRALYVRVLIKNRKI